MHWQETRLFYANEANLEIETAKMVHHTNTDSERDWLVDRHGLLYRPAVLINIAMLLDISFGRFSSMLVNDALVGLISRRQLTTWLERDLIKESPPREDEWVAGTQCIDFFLSLSAWLMDSQFAPSLTWRQLSWLKWRGIVSLFVQRLITDGRDVGDDERLLRHVSWEVW